MKKQFIYLVPIVIGISFLLAAVKCSAQCDTIFNFTNVWEANPEGSLTLLGNKLYGMSNVLIIV